MKSMQIISCFTLFFIKTVKPLNSGHLRLLKKLCLLLGGSLTKIVVFETKHFVRYLGCPLLGGFTVIIWDQKLWLVFLNRNFLVNQFISTFTVLYPLKASDVKKCLLANLNLKKFGLTLFLLQFYEYKNLPIDQNVLFRKTFFFVKRSFSWNQGQIHVFNDKGRLDFRFEQIRQFPSHVTTFVSLIYAH